MKIVPIFAEKLYSFHFETETENELERLLNLWVRPDYLLEFVKNNKDDISALMEEEQIVRIIIEDAKEIGKILVKLSEEDQTLDAFFKPLNNQEYRIIELSKRKGRNNYLRVYAIRIDSNIYVITGGAIKFNHLMEERPHTNIELVKIKKARDFFKDNDVIDKDSFYEFINEDL